MGLLNETQQSYYNGNDFGSYQFISLYDIITQFEFSYVGEDKIIPKIKRADIAFYAQRALQELSFDTLKSIKGQEIVVPATLQMVLPQDYVSYTKISCVGSDGVKYPLYPTSKNSNPNSVVQDTSGVYSLVAEGSLTILSTTITFNDEQEHIQAGMIVAGTSITSGSTVLTVSTTSGVTTITIDNAALATTTEDLTFTNADGTLVLKSESTAWSNYKSAERLESDYIHGHEDDMYERLTGNRYGLDPQHSNVNGSFYIDGLTGKIHFSSNISGKTVILDYISDSLGTDEETQVHKFAEEAMYKCIAYAILSTQAKTQEYIVQRFKKEKFAAVRTAKLRLSNIKLEELTQILRGKSKQIKH